ncbi:unnamed protein product [Heterosigma akashiwo]
MYLSDRTTFNSTARFWTETYAQQRSEDEAKDDVVERLQEMGFDREAVTRALQENGDNEPPTHADRVG